MAPGESTCKYELSNKRDLVRKGEGVRESGPDGFGGSGGGGGGAAASVSELSVPLPMRKAGMLVALVLMRTLFS